MERKNQILGAAKKKFRGEKLEKIETTLREFSNLKFYDKESCFAQELVLHGLMLLETKYKKYLVSKKEEK